MRSQQKVNSYQSQRKMGIHGLTSFIDNNPHLLKDHRLHDCRVVIDGNNLYHFLYYYCNVRFQFGGDYDVYHRKISMIFNMFKTCNVEVFVVFDGAYTVDGKKFKTTIGRARDRVYAAQRIMYGQRGTLIPCLAQQTFRQSLDKLGIQHVTCDFEADNQLATLANRWNCPVISNDSDFYIFDLSGGFIPLDYIDFRPCQVPKESTDDEKPYNFLPVQYYHVDEFIKCFKSLNRSVLPLFATMLGNDYVNAAAFEAFYKKRTPKIASRRYSASKKHQKIVSVLYWLEEKGYKGAEELASKVLTFIRQERRQHVEKLLTESMSGYTDTQAFETFDLKVFLEGDRSAAMQETDDVTNVNGEGLPAWFTTACRCGEIPVFLLNAVLLHHVILPTQVESSSRPAAFETSKGIRETIHSLLLGRETSPNGPGVHQTQDPTQQPSSELPASQQNRNHGNTSSDCQLEKDDSNSPTPSNPQEESSEEKGSESKRSTATSAAKETGILEYTRHHKELWRIMVQPYSALPMFGKLPSLERIPTLSPESRQAVLVETLGVSAAFARKFEPAVQLYMMSLVFWARKTTPPVTLHHLKGILLSAVLLHVHKEIAERESRVIEESVLENNTEVHNAQALQNGDGVSMSTVLSNSKTSQETTAPYNAKTVIESQENSMNGCCMSITSVCHSVEDKVLKKVQNNLKKYYQDPAKISNKNPPDHDIFHGNAQFQACVLDAVHLNSLLCCPLPTPQPAVLFNGTFVYAIIHELKLRSNPELFLSEMLVKGSSLVVLFDFLCAQVVQEIGDGVFAELKSQGRKCCKGAKKKNKGKAGVTAAAVQGSSVGDTDSGLMAEGHTGQDTTVALCDLNNRFGALLLEDDS